jgi:hypothetical protein
MDWTCSTEEADYKCTEKSSRDNRLENGYSQNREGMVEYNITMAVL